MAWSPRPWGCSSISTSSISCCCSARPGRPPARTVAWWTCQLTIKLPRWGKTDGFGTAARNDVSVGTLVTLDLPANSPVADLPWVITIGSLGDEEDWEPVVCGPYERAHALALAQAVVADEDLLAVVEPLLPRPDAEAIRDEIELARAAADETEDDDADDDDHETRRVRPGRAPTEAEVRAGWARIAAKLAG